MAAVASLATPLSPFDPRTRPLAGALWQWGQNKAAFESGSLTSSRKLIVIGGLTDGLLPCRWVPALAQAAAEHGWSTVQPILSSAYAGYGTGMLQRDADELSQLVEHMVDERGAEQVAIVGHSTGCQVACTFAKLGSARAVSCLAAIVLQAPVSDQESGAMDESTAKWLQVAKASPRPDKALMPLEAHYVPITCARYLSLYDSNGEQPDDLFSSYLTDEQLRQKLGHLDGMPVLVAYSLADQYVPAHVDKRGLVARLTAAIGSGAVPLCLEGGDHDLRLPADGSAAAAFVSAAAALLRDARPSGKAVQPAT